MNSTCTSCLSGLFYTSALGFETLPTPEKRSHLNEEHAWKPPKEHLPPSSLCPVFLIQCFIFLPSPSLTSVPGSATFHVLSLFSYFLFPLCILEIGWYESLHTRCNTWQNHSSAYTVCAAIMLIAQFEVLPCTNQIPPELRKGLKYKNIYILK